MPVPSASAVIQYTGGGGVTVFPYPFKILVNTDIGVTVDGVVKVLTTDYTVSGVGVESGGNVTFVVAPSASTVITLYRNATYDRVTDYQENGDLLANTLDTDLDRAVMLIQQLKANIDRAPSVAVGSALTGRLGLTPEASKFIAWASDALSLMNVDIATLTPTSLAVSSFGQTLLDDATAQVARATLGVNLQQAPIVCGRLSCSSTDPAPESATDSTNIYWIPNNSNRIALWNGTTFTWELFAGGLITKSHAAIANSKLFDVFAYDNAGTFALELVQWTNDTTRATAIEPLDGIVVKSGDLTRRYLATCYKDAGGAVVDNPGFRHVWNLYNQLPRSMYRVDTTDSWTSVDPAWHYANASSLNVISIVRGIGVGGVAMGIRGGFFLLALGRCFNSTATLRAAYPAGIGYDSGTVASHLLSFAQSCDNGPRALGVSVLSAWPNTTVGKHFFSWLEQAAGVDTQTFTGDAASPTKELQSGLAGIIFN